MKDIYFNLIKIISLHELGNRIDQSLHIQLSIYHRSCDNINMMQLLDLNPAFPLKNEHISIPVMNNDLEMI